MRKIRGEQVLTDGTEAALRRGGNGAGRQWQNRYYLRRKMCAKKRDRSVQEWKGDKLATSTSDDALVEEEVGPRAEDLFDRHLLDYCVGAIEPDARVLSGGQRDRGLGARNARRPR